MMNINRFFISYIAGFLTCMLFVYFVFGYFSWTFLVGSLTGIAIFVIIIGMLKKKRQKRGYFPIFALIREKEESNWQMFPNFPVYSNIAETISRGSPQRGKYQKALRDCSFSKRSLKIKLKSPGIHYLNHDIPDDRQDLDHRAPSPILPSQVQAPRGRF